MTSRSGKTAEQADPLELLTKVLATRAQISLEPLPLSMAANTSSS
jgi:hypothetical protein